MTNEQLEQQAFERGFHNVPEPYQFRRMPGEILRWREAESEAGSQRQVAFKEEIARRERRTVRLWQVFIGVVLLTLSVATQVLLSYLHLK